MSRRWSLAALALAPLIALSACDQIGAIWDRMRERVEAPGPAAIVSVPLEARALSGAVQPQADIAALLAPEPVLVAAGEILVGARVAARLPDAAAAMGLAGASARSLRAEGLAGLAQLPDDVAASVRARAEAEASAAAEGAVADVLGRLGLQGEVTIEPGGLISVDLAPDTASANTPGSAPGADLPDAMEWNSGDRCPRIVTQGQLEDDIALATRCAIERLAAARQFEYVEPNYIATSGFSRTPARTIPPSATSVPATTPRKGGVPNDPLYALQWDLRPRGRGEGYSAGGAGFAAYWRANRIGSAQVRVAVIDTGIDRAHPDLRESANVTSGIDLITNAERAGDGDGVDSDAQDAGDACGAGAENSYHGAHVAGTIGAAATNDRVGVAGGAWEVTIIPVRAIGHCGGELADIVSGIRWAAGVSPAMGADRQPILIGAPADIINMSLSIQAPCPASMQAAIDAVVARNVIVVVAAGNKANQAALFAPGNCNNVVVVGASDGRGELAFYSNFGAQVDILAPGGDMFADVDNDGRPDGILSTRATRSGCYDPIDQASTERCYYAFMQGTSMAAPHVSAALVLLAAETGLRGRALENTLFTRAVTPHPAQFGQIECARARNAIPVRDGAALCARPSGRGALDLARALAPP